MATTSLEKTPPKIDECSIETLPFLLNGVICVFEIAAYNLTIFALIDHKCSITLISVDRVGQTITLTCFSSNKFFRNFQVCLGGT